MPDCRETAAKIEEVVSMLRELHRDTLFRIAGSLQQGDGNWTENPGSSTGLSLAMKSPNNPTWSGIYYDGATTRVIADFPCTSVPCSGGSVAMQPNGIYWTR